MKVKIVFGEDVRRWHYDEHESSSTSKYKLLKEFVQDAFNFLNDESFVIEYCDDEDDKVLILSKQDFEDALNCAEKEKRKSLKLFVSINKSESNLLKGEETSSDDDNDFTTDGENDDSSSVIAPESPKSEESNCNSWRESALDFLQNKEIQSLLPQFIYRIVVALKTIDQHEKNEEKKVEDDDGARGEKDLDFSTILISILSEDKFSAIGNHEFIESKLPFYLPLIGEKVKQYKDMLFLVNENVILTWIPHLIEILIDGLTKYENIKFDIEMDDNINDGGAFIPQWFAFVTNATNNRNNVGDCHNGVICDSCNVNPILGVRYKCLVCDDFDLCEKCESLNKHDSNHPLVKFNVELNKINDKDFDYFGLHEIIRRLGGRRKVFGYGRFGHGRFTRGRGRGSGRGRGGRRFSYSFDHGFGHDGLEQFGCPPPPPAFFEDDEPECETLEGFGDCGRGRGRGRGRRFGRHGLHNSNDPFTHPHPRYHYHHYRRPHHHGNHYNNKTGGRTDFVRQLKEERKEYRHELKDLQKMEKQMLKQCCRVDKKIDKLKKQMEKEKEKKQLKKEKTKSKENIKVSCICGERMLNVKVCEAYGESLIGNNNNACVRCDMCNKECIDNLLIYHCPNNGDSLLHPSGYDICCHCAKLQQKKFVKERKEKKRDEQKKMKKDEKGNFKSKKSKKGKKQKKEKEYKKDKRGGGKKDKNESELSQALIEKPSIVNSDEIEDITIVQGDDHDDVKDNNNEDSEENDMDIEENSYNVVKDDVAVSSQVEDDFVYLKELKQIESMGFDDDEYVRNLLVTNKGNVGNVIETLFQSS